MNSFVGSFSGFNVTTGSYNTSIGYSSAPQLTTGVGNTLLGYASGNPITTGSLNTAIGFNVQVPVATGSCQLAIGFGVGQNWLTGCSNKSIRPAAGIVDCNGSTGTPGQVLASNGANAVCWSSASVPSATPAVAGIVFGCTASNNVALGQNTGTLGIGLVSIGCGANKVNTSVGNTVVGLNAHCTSTTGCRNTVIGINALQLGNGNYNTAVGAEALNAATGGCNVALGHNAGLTLTSGSNNVLLGWTVQAPNPAGNCQLAIGYTNGQYWITGDNTKAIKPGAGIRDCNSSTGLANQVLMSNGANAICWGAVPGLCGFTCTATPFNTALGFQSGTAITTGVCNTFVGYQAGCGSTSGSCNVLIGNGNLTPTITSTANNNVVIGPRLQQFNLGASSTNNVAISSFGSVLYSLSAPANNTIQIGNLSHSAAYVNVGWTAVSDIRDKTEVANVALGLDFVKDLSPIEYKRCDRETGELNADKIFYGFSAQDVISAEKKHAGKNVIIDDSDEDRLRLTSDHLIPVLVNAIKELSAEVESLKAQLNK
jgi:hypothetical protein